MSVGLESYYSAINLNGVGPLSSFHIHHFHFLFFFPFLFFLFSLLIFPFLLSRPIQPTSVNNTISLKCTVSKRVSEWRIEEKGGNQARCAGLGLDWTACGCPLFALPACLSSFISRFCLFLYCWYGIEHLINYDLTYFCNDHLYIPRGCFVRLVPWDSEDELGCDPDRDEPRARAPFLRCEP